MRDRVLVADRVWVRSYLWNDGISGTNGSAFTRILTVQGNIYLQRLAPNRGGPIPWKSFHKPITRNTRLPDAQFLVLADGWEIAVPFWLPTVVIAALSVGPWLRWKLSLRTLLIVTTLVAVVLGVIVWVR